LLQCGVDEDASRPSQKIGATLKTLQVRESGDHRVLHGIFCVLWPWKNSQRSAMEFLVAGFEKRVESFAVTSFCSL
jgi:hypothetical protein